MSGGAFHPMIRLSYAIEVDSDWELAESLASWCMAYQDLGDLKTGIFITESDTISILRNLSQDESLRAIPLDAPNIFKRMKQVSSNERFLRYLWQGIAVAYVTFASIESSPPTRTLDNLTWEQIFFKARQSRNDHVIKFSYTTHKNGNYKGGVEAFFYVRQYPISSL